MIVLIADYSIWTSAQWLANEIAAVATGSWSAAEAGLTADGGIVQAAWLWIWDGWLVQWVPPMLFAMIDALPNWVGSIPWGTMNVWTTFINQFFPLAEVLAMAVGFGLFFSVWFVVKLLIRLF